MRGNILDFLDKARADAPVHGDKLREFAQLTMYSIAVPAPLVVALGDDIRSTLSPSESQTAGKEDVLYTSAGFDHTAETVMTESGP
jgi:hypothetical protein